jgi:transposase
MTTSEKRNTLFVGIDVHKDTHTAVGVSPFGEKIFEIKIGNYDKDFENLSKKVEEMRATLSPYYGLEDCHGYGERLAEYLFKKGEKVFHVSSILVDRQRQNNTHPEKSDSLDAYGVAEVMIKKIDTLPIYTISEESEKAKQIKDVSHDREYLVYERTRLKNNLHNVFHKIWNTEYRDRFKDPFSKKALTYWLKTKVRCDSFTLKTMHRKVKRLIAVKEEIRELEKDLEELLEGYTVQTASGCGTVLAGIIVGEVGDIARFNSPASLAKYAGCSPRNCSSGKRNHHIKTRSGNRRLNCAFHHMALSQISKSGNEKGKLYFKRKVSEGKSKSQALVCLRRQIVNIVWNMMKRNEIYRF